MERDQTGTISGTRPGSNRDQLGQIRDQTGTQSGPNRDPIGTKPGPKRDQTGTISGTRLGLNRDKERDQNGTKTKRQTWRSKAS